MLWPSAPDDKSTLFCSNIPSKLVEKPMIASCLQSCVPQHHESLYHTDNYCGHGNGRSRDIRPATISVSKPCMHDLFYSFMLFTAINTPIDHPFPLTVTTSRCMYEWTAASTKILFSPRIFFEF